MQSARGTHDEQALADKTVLYLAVGDPCHPSIGIDVVVRDHLNELSAQNRFALCGTFVTVGTLTGERAEGCRTASRVTWPGVLAANGATYPTGSEGKKVAQKLKLLLQGRPLMMFAFRSPEARRYIKQQLSQGPDLVVLDHINTTVNLSWLDLLKHGHRIVFISHDNNFRAMTDAARLRRGWPGKLALGVQALQLGALELFLARRARATIFLSEFDRRTFGRLTQRPTLTLCPVPPSPSNVAFDTSARSPTAVFIGSPSFAPNAFALRWLVEQFAPHLLRLDARVHVLLVGAGTEALDATAAGSGPSNVQGLGFVTQERLEHLLRTCVAVLSPVVHGSGIKIKVLQSFAAGCPVFATEESLRGFEFMGVPPRLRLDDPQTGAAELVQFANSVEQQQSERAQVERAWRSYAALRRGRLVEAVAAQLV